MRFVLMTAIALIVDVLLNASTKIEIGAFLFLLFIYEPSMKLEQVIFGIENQAINDQTKREWIAYSIFRRQRMNETENRAIVWIDQTAKGQSRTIQIFYWLSRSQRVSFFFYKILHLCVNNSHFKPKSLLLLLINPFRIMWNEIVNDSQNWRDMVIFALCLCVRIIFFH